MDELTHKFVAVLNKKVPAGSLMNALGHMAAGLAGSYPNLPEMRFDSYFDKDGGDHKSISDNPFIATNLKTTAVKPWMKISPGVKRQDKRLSVA